MSVISAAEISDRDSYKAWLLAWPKKTRRKVIVAMASRHALRMLPLLNSRSNMTLGQLATLTKYCFWRNTIARAARAWPDRAIADADADAAASPAYAPPSTAAYAVAYAATYAAYAATVTDYSAAYAAASTASTVAYAAVYTSAIWENIRMDAAALEAGAAPFALYSTSLWGNEPPWSRDEWRDLKTTLASPVMREGEWTIWLEWYEPIIQGHPAFNLKNRKTADALERRIALGDRDKTGKFNKDFWNREPREINREIAEWVAEARAAQPQVDVELPQQSLDATMFGLNAEGKIARVAVPPEQRLLITPQQQLEYQALREDALELAARGQVLGPLGTEVGALSAALPEDMSHAKVFDVWRALNKLRRSMNAHARVVEFSEPHEAKLEPAIAENLDALLRTANVFAFGDPGLLRRDELAIAPQDRPALQVEKTLGDALAAAAVQAPNIFTADAHQVVANEEANAKGAGSDAHGQQAIDQTNKTRRNWIAAMLSALKTERVFAWKEMRGGAYKTAGAGAVTAVATDLVGATAIYPTIWNFIAAQGASLLNYVKAVYQNPAITDYVAQALKLLGG